MRSGRLVGRRLTIELREAMDIIVLNVCVHGLVADGTSSIIDLVARINKVTTRQTEMFCEVDSVVGCLTSTKALNGVGADITRADRTFGTVRARLEACREARNLATVGILTNCRWLGWGHGFL